jgi:DNA-binding response OmpR family regulator
MRNAGRRVTRAMIVEHVWNLSFDTSTNIVDVYINYLRSITSLTSELQTADSSLNSVVTALQQATLWARRVPTAPCRSRTATP